jgi:hypothetical protein
MGNAAKETPYGYVCTVRGCDKRNNRRFTLIGLCQHIKVYHGDKELEKRLRTFKQYK